MNQTVRDILLDGIGGTLPAIAAMRIALGAFFVLSGFHKLTNKERHRDICRDARGPRHPTHRHIAMVCSGR